MENDIKQRQVAYKITLADIHTKQLIKQDGWLPNYLLQGSKKISRINVIGVIVNIPEDDPNQIIIDDSNNNITIRKFDGQDINFKNLKIGDIINVIGRIREYNNEKYIMPEIIKPIQDIKWVQLRKKEIELLSKTQFYNQSTQPTSEKNQQIVQSPTTSEISNAETILNKIRELDSGNGADINLIINELGPDTEKLINTLLEQGDIFTTQPGKVKVLE